HRHGSVQIKKSQQTADFSPIPYYLLPTPYSLLPIPDSRFPIPYFLFPLHGYKMFSEHPVNIR
ncbi:MAG: hypothetical protein F6K57_23175, partial [Moorea sp. SIO4A5]|nr:hypothetical protein [Moorena sp. SIO4A5]